MKELNYLEELIRKVQGMLSPGSHEDLMQKIENGGQDGMWKYYDKHPDCFMKMDNFLFPICGQGARKCPMMIDFSIKMVKTMLSKEGFDSDKLNGMLQKLERLKGKYSKMVPKPVGAAVRKGASTRHFKQNMR